MITHLIVPIDGSHRSRRALPVAIDLAERIGASVEILTAVSPGTDDHQLRDEIDGLVRQAGSPVAAARIVPGDDVADVIAAHTRTQPDTLVIMSSHGPSRASGVLTESVASELLADGLAVVLVGPQAIARPAHLPVVACIDSSPDSQQVIPTAAAWAQAAHVPLVLVRVIRPDAMPPPRLMSRVAAPADGDTGTARDLQQLAADTAEQWPDVDVRCRVVEYPWNVVDALAVHLERHPAQLIAVASHVRSGWGRLAHPSVTTGIVRELEAPVLVVPIVEAPLAEPDIATDAGAELEVGKALPAVEQPQASTAALAPPFQPAPLGRPAFATVVVPVVPGGSGDPAVHFAADLAAAAGADIQQVSCADGADAATALIEAAGRATNSIVCMSTGAPRQIADTVLSSITGRVLRWSPRPVVLIGPHARPPEFGFSEVIACVDGSLVSEAVADLAGTWARLLGVAARILEVVDPDSLLPGSSSVESRYVHRLAARVERRHGVVAMGTTIVDGDAARSIRTWSSADPAALFVMASHGLGLSEHVMGGVVNDVVRHVPNAVVVIPAHIGDPAAEMVPPEVLTAQSAAANG